MTIYDFIGKTVAGITKDDFGLFISFTDGTSLNAEAKGYEGTRLVVTGERQETVTRVEFVKQGFEF